MTKLRFLGSIYLPSIDKMANFNDELDIKDKNLADYLVKSGYADELIEEKSEPKSVEKPKKPAKKALKKAKKEVD